jgi:hypothetical protein
MNTDKDESSDKKPPMNALPERKTPTPPREGVVAAAPATNGLVSLLIEAHH